MKVDVLLFARARNLVGAERMTLALPPDATVAGLRDELARAAPSLQPLLIRSLIAVNGAYAADSSVIPENAEIALIPPVSGG